MMYLRSCFGSCSSFLQLLQARVSRCLRPMKQPLILPALKPPRLFTPSSHPPYQHTVLKAWLPPPSHHQSLSSPLHPRPYQQLEYRLQVVDLLSCHYCMLPLLHSLRKN
jgi:hypothetical protein